MKGTVAIKNDCRTSKKGKNKFYSDEWKNFKSSIKEKKMTLVLTLLSK